MKYLKENNKSFHHWNNKKIQQENNSSTFNKDYFKNKNKFQWNKNNHEDNKLE